MREGYTPVHAPQYLPPADPKQPQDQYVFALGQPYKTPKSEGGWPCQSSPRPWTGNARETAASQTSKKIRGHGANPQDQKCETPVEALSPSPQPSGGSGHWPLISSHLPATLSCRAITGGLAPLQRERHLHGNEVIPSTLSCPARIMRLDWGPGSQIKALNPQVPFLVRSPAPAWDRPAQNQELQHHNTDFPPPPPPPRLFLLGQ